MLKDLWAGGSAAPTNFASSPQGTKAYFLANSQGTGTELWVTDGTLSGTLLTGEVVAGSGGITFNSDMVALGDSAFFVHDGEIWSSVNGAPPQVRTSFASQGKYVDESRAGLVAYEEGGRVYFRVLTDGHPSELWSIAETGVASDALYTINPMMGLVLNGMMVFYSGSPGVQYFYETDGDLQHYVWSQGVPHVYDDGNAIVWNGALYFVGDDGVHGRELWKFEAGSTSMVIDLVPGPGSPFDDPDTLISLTAGLERFYFLATTAAHGTEVWSSDGTVAGTVVHEVNPGVDSSFPGSLKVAAGTAYFRARTAAEGDELWRIPTGKATASLVADLYPGPGSPGINHMVTSRDGVVFSASDGANGVELWRADAARVYRAVPAGNGGGTWARPLGYMESKGYMLFSGEYGASNYEPGVLDLRRPRTIFDGSEPVRVWSEFEVLGGKAYFDGELGGTGRELFSYSVADGLTVHEIFAGPQSSSPGPFASLGGNLYFAALGDAPSGRELWRFDPVAGVASLVKELVGGNGGGDPRELVTLGSNVYFAGQIDSEGTRRLWKTNGTETGTVAIDGCPESPRLLTVAGSLLFFVGWVDGHGEELFSLNPTTSVCTKLTNLPHDNAQISEMVAVGSTVYFSPDEGSPNGHQLWRSNGTITGRKGSPLMVPMGGLYPTSLHAMDGNQTLLFSGMDDDMNMVLYRAKLNEPVPMRVQALGQRCAFPESFFTFSSSWPAGPSLSAFSCYHSTDGQELFYTDGSASGTGYLDINPGGSSSPIPLALVGPRLYFSAEDPALGFELHSSTGSGHEAFIDLVPGSGSSYPRQFAQVPGGYVFVASDAQGRPLLRFGDNL